MNEETELITVPAVPEITITVNQDYVAKIVDLETRNAELPTVMTNVECVMMNALNDHAAKLVQVMEGKRKEAKSPFIAAGKAIDDAVRPLIERVTHIQIGTGARLLRYRQEIQRKAAEQQRLQDAENLKREEEQRARERETELARRRNAAPPVRPAPPAPAPQPVQARVEVPVINVTTRKTKVLRIFAPAIVPLTVQGPDGICYVLHIINEAEVKRALKAGCDVPGARMEEEEGIVQK